MGDGRPRYRLLGPLEVEGLRQPLRGPKQQRLVITLLLAAGRTVSRERLIESLWGENPPLGVASALQTQVSRLRACLPERDGRTPLETNGSAYRLSVDPEDVDALRFQRLVTDARGQVDPAGRAETLSEALRLWRVPSLREMADLDEVGPALVSLDELRLAATKDWLRAKLEAGHLEGVSPVLDALIAEHPFDEEAATLAMLALYRAGRQADALRVFRDLRSRLVDELGIEPGPNARDLELAILRHDETLGGPRTGAREQRPAPRHNLPESATPLVGRAKELGDLLSLVRSSRLVTVTGPGGVGKTRLAIAAARLLLDELPDGAWLVALTGRQPNDDLIAELARVLAINWAGSGDLAATVAGALSRSTLLVVLDACEHALPEAARVSRLLLGAGEGIRVMSTSREPLRVSGERRFALRPLAVPPVPPIGIDALLDIAAARLFSIRLTEAGGTPPGDADAADMADIVTRLDGLPLAIELAAARAATLPLSVVRDGLADRFALLDPRAGGLRAALEWSWASLDAHQAAALSALGVFAGGFTLDAAIRVLPAADLHPSSIPALVADLVERSMVDWSPGAKRYRLLDSIRALALERLGTGRWAMNVRNRHAAWAVDLAAAAEAELTTPWREPCLARLDIEAANMAAAQEALVRRGDSTSALTLVAGLGWWWYHRGTFAEGRRALGAALSLPDDDVTPARAQALTAAARLAYYDDDLPTALGTSAQAVLAASAVGDPRTLGYARQIRGLALQARGDRDSVRVAAEAVESLRAAKDEWGTALALFYLGVARLMTGSDDHGRAPLQQSLDMFEGIGDEWGAAGARFYLGVLLRSGGHHHEGRALVEAAAESFRHLGDRWRLRTALDRLATLVHEDGGDATSLRREVDQLSVTLRARTHAGMNRSHPRARS